MKIDIFGCSGGVGPALRTTSLRLDDHILIDAGTGACDLPLADMMMLTDVSDGAGRSLIVRTVFTPSSSASF